MRKQEAFRLEIVNKYLNKLLTRKEAARLCDLSERSISRLAGKVERQGAFGVIHSNRGKEPHNKISTVQKEFVLDLVREKYFDFNLTHCLEILQEQHKVEDLSYATFRRWMLNTKLIKRAKRRSARVRKQRTRMAQQGLMLQMDGSPHRYNGRDEWWLIWAIDDATSEIPYGEFFLGEDTISCMAVLQKIIEKKGLPVCIYVDKAGLFGGPKRVNFSQFKRACEELGIKIIYANSPEAKGRVERSFDIAQDRLCPELRVRNIKSINKANDYLQQQFLPNYWNKKNTVTARNLEPAYKPLPQHINLKEVFCLKEYRSVKRDHTISYNSETFQVESPHKYSIWKQKIEIRTYQDLTWKAFYGSHEVKLTKIVKTEKLKLLA